MNTTFIYALNDPHTGRTRYVGVSKDPKQRLADHLSHSKSYNTHRDCWIRRLLVLKASPVLEILDAVPSGEWKFWEREYIRLYRVLGFDLTNLTDGGDGGEIWKGRKHSLETRLKMSKAQTGKRFSKEHCQKLSQRLVSMETRKKISESKLGKSIPSGRNMKGSNNPMYGKKHSLEARALMSGPRK